MPYSQTGQNTNSCPLLILLTHCIVIVFTTLNCSHIRVKLVENYSHLLILRLNTCHLIIDMIFPIEVNAIFFKI